MRPNPTNVDVKLLATPLVGIVLYWSLAAHSSADAFIKAVICQQNFVPSISSPRDDATVTSRKVRVVGKADARARVTLFNNGRVAAFAIAANSGDFSLDVPLQIGHNQMYAQAANSCGRTATSKTFAVSRHHALLPFSDFVTAQDWLIFTLVLGGFYIRFIINRRQKQRKARQK